MIKLNANTTKYGSVQVYDKDLEVFAYKQLKDYQKGYFEEPKALNIEDFVEFYLEKKVIIIKYQRKTLPKEYWGARQLLMVSWQSFAKTINPAILYLIGVIYVSMKKHVNVNLGLGLLSPTKHGILNLIPTLIKSYLMGRRQSKILHQLLIRQQCLQNQKTNGIGLNITQIDMLFIY